MTYPKCGNKLNNLICKECNCVFTLYVCNKCKRIIKKTCNECHNEIKHGFITHNTGRPVHGGNTTPYTFDDAQYFPGVCDKFRIHY